jgi:hypothetical protein
MTKGWSSVIAACVLVAAVSPAAARRQDDLVLRAMGFFQGRSSVTENRVTCDIPTAGAAIPEGTFAMGLWNTHGEQTLYFPNPDSVFGDPCGGWLALRNDLAVQHVLVDQVDVTFRVGGARRFRRAGVPMRGGFPLACRARRRARISASTLIPPAGAGGAVSASGAPNVAFLQLVPLVGPGLIECLHGAYATLPTRVLASLPLVASVSAVGTSDAGDAYRSNTVHYTLDLRHTCGNGRVDDGEECDPASTLGGCPGMCQPQGTPEECRCGS